MKCYSTIGRACRKLQLDCVGEGDSRIQMKEVYTWNPVIDDKAEGLRGETLVTRGSESHTTATIGSMQAPIPKELVLHRVFI